MLLHLDFIERFWKTKLIQNTKDKSTQKSLQIKPRNMHEFIFSLVLDHQIKIVFHGLSFPSLLEMNQSQSSFVVRSPNFHTGLCS